MKVITFFFCFLPLSPLTALGQSTCAGFSATTILPQVAIGDTTEHGSGNHSVATGTLGAPSPSNALTATCAYSSGSGANCNTTCKVTANPFSTSENGALSAVGTHMVASGWADGVSGATNSGSSCTGILGGGAVNCFTVMGSCLLTVNLSGGGVSLSTNGHQVWAQVDPIAFNCATEADPAKKSASGGDGGGSCGGGGSRGFNKGAGGSGGGGCSPVVIDTEGEGFHLTSVERGVMFDIEGDGHPVRIAWTASGYHNAFLALPGSDGLVHNGKELFGNFTPQPQSAHPNGFLALAEYDKPENGGREDGVIDGNDAVFSRLRLWIDENHDGVCQPNELHKLPEMGIYSLALSYFESRRTDEFGNQFRYKARVNPDQRRDPRDETATGVPGRWTYDVFFLDE